MAASLPSVAAALRKGETVTFRPRGASMTPRIRSGQRVTVRPLGGDEDLPAGSVVLARVNGRVYLHFAKKVEGGRVLIASMRRENGWTSRDNVFGVLG